MSCPHGNWGDCAHCQEIDDVWNKGAAEIAALSTELAALRGENERLAKRITELEPAADCWNALAKCYRMTFMGSAGCNPPDKEFSAGPAHITMNLWTAPPDYPDAQRDQGQQDVMGRSQFGNFMDIALKNAALSRAK